MQPRTFPSVAVILVFYLRNTNGSQEFAHFFRFVLGGKQGVIGVVKVSSQRERVTLIIFRVIVTIGLLLHSKVSYFASVCLCGSQNTLRFQRQTATILNCKGTYLIREKCNFRGYMRCHWGRLELLVCITFTLDLNISSSR